MQEHDGVDKIPDLGEFKTVIWPVSASEFALIVYDDSDGSTSQSAKIAIPAGWVLLGEASMSSKCGPVFLQWEYLFTDEAADILLKAGIPAAGPEVQHSDQDLQFSDFTWVKGFLIVRTQYQERAVHVLNQYDSQEPIICRSGDGDMEIPFG
jgi:hypothetical protein